MNLYLVTVHAECAMYEEQVKASSAKEAKAKARALLVEEGEIEFGDPRVRTYAEIIEEDV